jgi:hypothetical protein
MPDSMPAPWRRRTDPAFSTSFGVRELHAVFFEPVGERIRTGSAVRMLRIPETPVYEIVPDLQAATQTQPHVGFLRDTPELAYEIVRRASKMLPNHRRMALERTEACAWNCHGEATKGGTNG